MKRSLLFLLILFSSCKTSKEVASDKGVTDFQIISSGILYGAGEEGIESGAYLVNSVLELDAMTHKMNSVNASTFIAEYDNNFFNSYSLIFLFDKVRGSGGHIFELKRIEGTLTNLTLKVRSQMPEGMATSVMTQPFQVVKIAKHSGSLEIELISQ